jgi:hypothetical protein
MGKKYLIYVDILGYKGKAEEIAKITRLQVDYCREAFLRTPLKKKVDETKTTKFHGISEIEGSDNYILIVDSVEKALEIVGELTKIKIPHEDFNWIPLEVGVGTKEIDEDISVEPISRTEVIAFLKEDIINPYRGYFEQGHKESVRETFVLFTKDFYDDLEPLDKNHCTPICYKGKSFFLGDLEKIHEKCKFMSFSER